MQQNIHQFQPMDLSIRKYIDENFKVTSSRENPIGAFSPISYDKLMKDHYYEAILVRLGEERWWFQELYSEGLQESQIVLKMIRDELESRE